MSALAGLARGGWATRSMWSIADNLVQQGLSFAVFAVLARWLTPHEFGLLAIAHLMVLFARMSLLDAVAMPVVRAPQVDDRLFDWLFTMCTVVAAGVALLMTLLSWPLARFFGAPDLAPVLVGMSLSVLLFGLARAHEARLLREGNFRLTAIRSLCSVSAGGVVALVLASRGAGALALVAQQVVMGVVALVIALAAEWRVWRPRWHWSPALWREHAVEMRRVGLSAWVSYANSNGDSALVSVLLGPAATGLYNLAKRVLSAAYQVVASSLSRVGVSLFVQRQHDPVALAQAYSRMLGWTLLLLAPIYAIASLVAEPLVVRVFGEQWRASAPLFGWMSVAYVSQSAFWLGQNLSFATKHSRRALRFSSMQLALSAVLALSLSPLGMQGVAAGAALGSVTGCVAMQVAVYRQLKLSAAAFARAAMPALLGTAATAAALWGLPYTGLDAERWLGLALALVLGLACYATMAMLAHWLMRRLASA
ncbi:MAG: lipopolysaccharide biosynthesis protein [Rhizobacter sp.]|nr:lipopolysaccharide biosynthesis protein [Rhizobacter sp.]